MKIGVSLACCLSLAIGAGLLVAPSVAQASSIAGSYVIKDDKKARKSIDQAIERTVADVSRLFRGKARSKLRSQQKLCRNLSLTVGGKESTVTCASTGRGISAPSSGARKKVKHDGQTGYLSHKVTGSRLVQKLESDKGTRTATYSLSADGKTLTVSIALVSDKLDTPLRYTLVYVRRS